MISDFLRLLAVMAFCATTVVGVWVLAFMMIGVIPFGPPPGWLFVGMAVSVTSIVAGFIFERFGR